MMELTVVIVNYRVKYLLEQTLRAVEQAMKDVAGEVIVVDNLSGDDSIEFSRERHPAVTFIENKENVGFARANNQAIMQARGEFTLILNPDTIITPQCISEGIAWMRSHPKCGAIGARMMDANGVFLSESKRSFPTPWVSFCKIFGLSKLFPRSPWFAKYHLRYLSDTEPQCIDILSGAYMLCRTEVLKRLHGFDEDFFMYGEDIDLSYRIVQEGYENWFLPTPMIHYKGESTHKDSMRYVKVFYDAMLIFYRKHFPRFNIIFYPIVKLGVMVRAGMAMARRLFKRILPSNSEPASGSWPWVIISDNPSRVAERAGINIFQDSLSSRGRYNVLIDDGCHTCAQIVDYIRQHGDNDNLAFHIFADRHGVIISPKMSQS
ncbi:MAG: glycosyltransferase family 2 protein [Muribaculaceae bacterium]|nr:glycosyltransferase family 2 protein [Muribaculaceae bacterium]